MNVEYLESLALKSLQGYHINHVKMNIDGLSRLERNLHISLDERIRVIQEKFPQQKLIIAELGNFITTTIDEFNNIPNIIAFGIDLDHITINNKQDRKHLIRANIESMLEIPENTFHYIISHNCMEQTNLRKSLLEIYRILKPRGHADFDIASWYNYIPELIKNPVSPYMKVISMSNKFEGTLPQLFALIKEPRAGLEDVQRELVYLRFELDKP
ncbi:MAG: methyltransferase domain-containing protein [Nanoarchaeota archaeon]|nr:methyltransferase domain-containing protein [Nanoarchaeota archaeon]